MTDMLTENSFSTSSLLTNKKAEVRLDLNLKKEKSCEIIEYSILLKIYI